MIKALRNKYYHIYFLQDTHFTENIWLSQWGYKTFLSYVQSKSRGVAILFNNSCELDVYETFKDNNSNFLILDVSIDDLHVLLVNSYIPNLDTLALYTNLF